MLTTRFCSALRNMAPMYYAVAKGRKPGIYKTWDECKLQVNQFSGPVFKKFSSQAEAENFIKERSSLNQKPNYKTTASILGKRCVPIISSLFLNQWKPWKSARLQSQRDQSSERNNEKLSLKRQKKTTPKESINTISIEDKMAPGDYTIDSNGYVHVYTDGACSANGGKNARAGIGVWFGDNHPLNVSEAVVGRATNNMAEIQAVTVAAKQAKKAGIHKLQVNTDSKFLISCINNWMPKWKANGWKTMNNKPVINKVELLEMEEALKSLDISWNHVNGHVGIYGNEMADKLARAGCAKY